MSFLGNFKRLVFQILKSEASSVKGLNRAHSRAVSVGALKGFPRCVGRGPGGVLRLALDKDCDAYRGTSGEIHIFSVTHIMRILYR